MADRENKLLKQYKNGRSHLRIDKNVYSWVVNDLAVTYGTIFDNFRKWVKNDLKGVVLFNHEFVDTQLMSDKDYFWTSGILGQARKPVLNLQFEVDHTFEHPAYGDGYNFSAREAVNNQPLRETTFRVMAFENKNNHKESLDVRIAFKNVHITAKTGIVVTSRPAANNIAQYWHTVRKSNNQIYPFNQYVDFKIPDEIIAMLNKKFGLPLGNHHTTLKFLNHNSFVNVFYGMNGYDGKFYYFLRYPVKSFIRTEGMGNPEAWGEEGILVPEVYTLEREFTIDVLVPMFLSFTAYGDRLILDGEDFDLTKEFTDFNFNNVTEHISERYIEVERVFEEKHLLKEAKFKWNKEDLITHPTGTVTTKKISLEPFLDLEDDVYMQVFVKWAKEKGYRYMDLFNFQLFQSPGIGNKKLLENKQVKKKPIESLEDEQMYTEIPKDAEEYEYYLKNMEDFFIVDFKPDLERELYGELYVNLAIRNEFENETKAGQEDSFANDDMGIATGYSRSHYNNPDKKY